MSCKCQPCTCCACSDTSQGTAAPTSQPGKAIPQQTGTEDKAGSGSPSTRDQEQSGFYVNVWLTVKNDMLVQFKQVQGESFSHREPGLVAWRIYADPTNDHRFLWSQIWESEAAQKAAISKSGHSGLMAVLETTVPLNPVVMESPGKP